MATNRIKELRTNKNMTQSELGKIVNVQKSAISKYEKNRAEPSMDILRKLANYFNVTTDYLLGRTDDPTPPDSAASRPSSASEPELSARAKAHARKYDALSDDHKKGIDAITDAYYISDTSAQSKPSAHITTEEESSQHTAS